MVKKHIFWLLPICWMGIIFYSSHQPYENQDVKPLLNNFINVSFLEPYLNWLSFTYHESVVSVEQLGVAGFIEFFIRKGAHVSVFFVLCLLFYVAFRKAGKQKHSKALIFSLFLTVIYAISDEIHQGFTPNRTPYVGDVILDSFGALLAVGLLVLFLKRKGRRPL
ncbi:putative integral membrane protein [Oceanobacillus picturae]|uniref:Integral membrane protein n=1 Tax=Oceanobacillus picturae TaxID=171693 RepID=W9AKT4_9BACI|nr:VanZ family protein [Oceanobacillus picturae]CDO03276.1 putative integral membrane protein [Oceanobacillus picturae]